jgi:hypothetical protein
MKNAIYSIAALAAAMLATSTLAHDGHGLGGTHWHATDVLGFVAVVALAALIWFKRK